MTKKLHNSFIEYLIVIGFDQETGLITSESAANKVCRVIVNFLNWSLSFKFVKTNLNDVWNISYQPTVLASINNENVVFPKRMNKKSNFYPPPNLKKTLTAKVIILKNIL